jgi:hypothetical protein
MRYRPLARPCLERAPISERLLLNGPVSRSAASIASTAKTVQSSSGAKHTATAAAVPRDEAGKLDKDSPRSCGYVDPAMFQSQQ